MKVFLDSNIILDFLDHTRPTHEDAKQIVHHLIMNDIETYLSEDMLTTIYYISKDKTKVLEFFETILQIWKAMPFGLVTILEAIAMCKNDTGKDFEDVVQCLAAKTNGCGVLVTNDKQFAQCGIEIMNSSEFLKRIEM